MRPRSRNRAATSASSRFAEGSCDRSAVQMSRTVVPVPRSPAAAPEQTAAIPSSSAEPAPHVEQRPPADLDIPDTIPSLGLDELPVTCSRASASCSSAIGRSNARSSSACDAPLAGAMSAARIAGSESGAAMPRDLARWSAVSGRTDPSRWRCSSAFGIARSHAARSPCRGTDRGWRRPHDSMLRCRPRDDQHRVPRARGHFRISSAFSCATAGRAVPH